ncbi:hypothetical protein D6D01_06542, partial [Aureobasidium pullulans]
GQVSKGRPLEPVCIARSGRGDVTNSSQHVRAASATCQYEMPISSASVSVTQGGPRGSPSSLPWVYGEPDLIATTIHDYATKLFASAQRLDAILFDYFSRVHQWMPFISRQQFYGRLSRLSHTPDHSFVLLICCMHLILCIPPQVEKSPYRSVEYVEVKRLLALAESQGPLTIDLVRCGLIVALYEMNHGAFDESYISLGICARAGIVLGLNQLQEREHASQDSLYVMSEEKRRTWWAIIILERVLRLQRPEWPTAVRDPSSNDLLPMDDAEWDQLRPDDPSSSNQQMSQNNSMEEYSRAMLSLSTPSQVRVGYFARLAQVSHLLGLVLRNKFDPTPDEAFNAQETQQLRRTTAVFAELLPKEATAADCSHYCGPIAILQSAQLILEQIGIKTDYFVAFNLATKVLCAEVIRLAEQLNIELAETQADLLRPLAIYSVYQVAQIYVRQYRRDPDLDYENGIRTLSKTLGFFEQRWRVAGLYKAEITSAIGLPSRSVCSDTNEG